MFDFGDFAIGNVRIARDLRRRRNDDRNHDAYDHGGAGKFIVVGNIGVDGTFGDVGSVDILRNAGDVRAVGNVRLRLKQHCGIIEPNINVTDHDERRRSRRNSAGIHGDRQSRRERRSSGTDAQRIAHCRHCGTKFDGSSDAHDFTDGKHDPMKQFFICERERS